MSTPVRVGAALTNGKFRNYRNYIILYTLMIMVGQLNFLLQTADEQIVHYTKLFYCMCVCVTDDLPSSGLHGSEEQ